MDTQSSSVSYEETPEIPTQDAYSDMAPPPKPPSNSSSILTAIIVLVLFFIIGFWLSGSIRTYVGNFFGNTKQGAGSPTPTPKSSIATIPYATTTPGESGATASSGTWKTYQVLNGRTRVTYEGISFTLPLDVLPPICDGSSCGSQGTYLPGGTRFTVALRGEGQVLPDYRGKIISDLKGIPFPVSQTTVKGREATEFTGSFTGTTVGGYVFSQMHGFMISITPTISLEINHFSPSGIVTNFTNDDALFTQIVQSLILPTTSLEKGGVSSPSATF